MSARNPLWLAALLWAALRGPAAADDWTRFRGPNGSAVSSDAAVPTEWGDEKNLLWKVALPGAGFSSPVVTGDKVFVTCYTGGEGNLRDLKRHLVCVDRQSGKKLWTKEVPAVLPEFRSVGRFAYHGYASPTPATDGERVYCLFGTTGLVAFDMQGKELWRKSVGTETNAVFGSGASPVLYKDYVIVPAYSESEAIYALDKKTGEQVWKAVGSSLANSYCTPVVLQGDDGKDELLVGVAGEVWSLDPNTGKLQWYEEIPATGGFCTSLVGAGDTVYAVGGGGKGRKARAAIRLESGGGKTRPKVLWSANGGSYVPSPVLHDGHLFWVDDDGTAVCVDAKTGKQVASKRLGAKFYASAVVAGGKLYAVSRFDGAYVLEATPELTPVARNELSDDSDFSASPAIADGQLFLRSDRYLYCVGQRMEDEG